ncbi:hypothetical protein TNCV_1793401 [Trichonephila clavipes]|nr:hypothetical protein TNCV_1793401 [Trichonephila clavipes]
MFWLGSTPILRSTLEVFRGLSPLFPFQQHHERSCGSKAILSTPSRKGTIHLRTSVPSPGFEQRPNGTEVSVTNHYTGWATCVGVKKLMLSDEIKLNI